MTAPTSNCKFPGNTNLKEAIQTLEGRTTIQRNLDKLEEQANDSVSSSSRKKNAESLMEDGIPCNSTATPQKGPGGSGAQQVATLQCIPVAMMANHLFHCTSKGATDRTRK